MSKALGSLLFVNKKKQQNFVNLELVCAGLSNVRSDLIKKVFCFFFSKKMLLP